MSLSHAQSQTLITTQDIFNQLLEDAKSINNKAKNHHFSSLEKELHQVFSAAERECMKKLLMQYDWDYPTFRSGEREFIQ